MFKQWSCNHDYQWIPFHNKTKWIDNNDGTLSWDYDLYKHKCNKCNHTTYKKYIIDNGKIIN